MDRGKIVVAALVAACADNASADTIVSASKALISSGGPGLGRIADTYNQAGLLIQYSSGETDFDSYLAEKPAHSRAGGRWFSGVGGAASVTYDLGVTRTIRALALWNEDTYGIGAFNLSYSTDGVTFLPLAPTQTPGNNPAGANYGPDVFGFRPTKLRYVRLDMFACPQSSTLYPLCGVGEVAFAAVTSDEAAVARKPATFSLIERGAGAIANLQRRARLWVGP